jgi:heme exporter protein A
MSGPEPQILLYARDLSVARGDRVLIEQLSLKLVAGERLLLRGRNGAGKTSLLETLAGVRAPALGGVERLATLVWVGHRNGLNPGLSAEENLGFWCKLNELPDTGVADALKRMGLVGRSRSRPSRLLSTGQKRRAAIARLIVSPARLWLIDEPLAGLDVEALPLVADLLAAHEDRGGAAILTTHQALPDRVAPHRVIDL